MHKRISIPTFCILQIPNFVDLLLEIINIYAILVRNNVLRSYLLIVTFYFIEKKLFSHHENILLNTGMFNGGRDQGVFFFIFVICNHYAHHTSPLITIYH